MFRFVFLLLLVPQSNLPAAPPQSTLPDPWYIVRADDSRYWSYANDIDALPAKLKHDVQIWHANAIASSTLRTPTRDELKAALKRAKAESGVSRPAGPFDSKAADGSDKLPVGSYEALDEVNRQRAQRGLPPYVRDEGLTLAAANCAAFRAARRIGGHTQNDFEFVPQGCSADVAGCAAWPDGFGACAMFENWRRAGAVYVIGPDGLRYCHLFCGR